MKTETSPDEVLALFVAQGGQPLLTASALAAKAAAIESVVFDWDGVFNDGKKGGGVVSGFSEADSMGTNMLRFGLWLRRKQLPTCAVISGEKNLAAVEFAGREHFDAVYSAVRDKHLALEHLCDLHRLKTEQVACAFDDINDLAMARLCGLRFLVNRYASAMLTPYAVENGLCDYVTASTGGDHAVREISELILGLIDQYHAVVGSRASFDSAYAAYFAARQGRSCRFYRQENERIVSVDKEMQ